MQEITTVQVRRKTIEMLNTVKKENDLKTYDDAIWAIKKKKGLSFYGFLARKKRFSREEVLKGLRDKHDRF